MTSTKHRVLLTTATAAAALAAGVVGAPPAAAGAGSSAGGSSQSGYNAIPSKVSGNVPSEGFEASADSSFGDEVVLGGSARRLQSMSVVLSSWGCETGRWNTGDCVTTPGATVSLPMTFTVYADDNGAPGAVLATSTTTVDVAYRPSASTRCTGGKWFNSKDRTCYSGLPQTVAMSFQGVTLPDSVIWSVAYSTTHYGTAPVGESAPCFTSSGGCGYDSLNVGAFSFANAPYAGTDVDADAVFRNGAMESGWADNRPLGQLITK